MIRTISRLLAMAAVCGACAGCQIDVEGVVRDSETKEPISGAVVQLGGEQTTTNERGFYAMEADDEENLRVSVHAPGYKGVSEMRTLPEEPDPAYISYELAPTEPEEKPPVKVETKVTNEGDRETPTTIKNENTVENENEAEPKFENENEAEPKVENEAEPKFENEAEPKVENPQGEPKQETPNYRR